MADGPHNGLIARYGPLVGLLVVATLVLAGVLLHGGVDAAQVGRAYFLGVGALVVVVMVREVGQIGRGWQGGGPPKEPAPAPIPPELAKLQDSLRASRVSTGHYQQEVLPLLREIASDRLLQQGISLDRDPARAAISLGPELSAVLLATRDLGLTPSRGPSQRELSELLTALEAVGQ